MTRFLRPPLPPLEADETVFSYLIENQRRMGA
jgi:hypothetical protein